MCIFVFAYLCVCGHKHMFPGMRLFVRKGLCVHPFCARFHPMVCCARIHSTTFTCGPRPRASLHPNLGQGDILPHRYLGGDLALFLHRVRILPISEIKDGSSQESVLLKKLLALSTKYSGSEFPTDQDLLGLVRVSWMCTTLGQRMMCNCGIPAAPCAPAEFWTSSKHTVASNLHQGRLASKIPNLSTLLLCKNGC